MYDHQSARILRLVRQSLQVASFTQKGRSENSPWLFQPNKEAEAVEVEKGSERATQLIMATFDAAIKASNDVLRDPVDTLLAIYPVMRKLGITTDNGYSNSTPEALKRGFAPAADTTPDVSGATPAP